MRGREGRGWAKPKPLAIVWEPLVKVTVGKVEVVVIEEKRYLLPDMWSEVPESRIQGPREDVWVRQVEALPVEWMFLICYISSCKLINLFLFFMWL